jgi:hypothetical protein
MCNPSRSSVNAQILGWRGTEERKTRYLATRSAREVPDAEIRRVTGSWRTLCVQDMAILSTDEDRPGQRGVEGESDC